MLVTEVREVTVILHCDPKPNETTRSSMFLVHVV